MKSFLLSKTFLHLIILAVILLGFLFLTRNNASKVSDSSKEPALTKINVGRSIDPGRSLPVLVSEQKGIFKKYNLDVESQVVNKGIDAALISGQIDVVNDAVVTFLAAAVKGADLKLVGMTLQVDPYYIVSNTTKENIRTVAVNRLGGQDYYQTINSLRLLGVDVSKVTFIISGEYAGKYPLLLRGDVDTAGYQPIADYFKIEDQFKKDGIKLLLNRTDNPNAYYPIGIVTRGDYIKKNPETVKNFVLALKEAVEYARSHKADSIKILMTEYQLKELEANLIYTNFIASTNNVEIKPRIDYLKTLLDDMSVEIKEAPKYDLNNFIDTSSTSI